MTATQYCTGLALKKAESIVLNQASTKRPDLVVCADTIVACDDEIFGKPKDEADAIQMLNKMSGEKHQVHTGKCHLFLMNFCSSVFDMQILRFCGNLLSLMENVSAVPTSVSSRLISALNFR